jgi:hypothetical protein
LNVAFAPDLQVTVHNPPIDIVTDTNFNLSWTLKNVGNRRIETPFVDRVVLSSSPTPNVVNILADFPFAQSLDPNQSVTRTQILNIQRNKVSADGNYYLIVMTDAEDKIKEGAGENNNFHAVPVKVRRSLLPDLVVDGEIVVPQGQIFFGQTITVKWTVKNIGNGSTNASQWQDWVYLSTDDIPEIEDPFKVKVENATYLPAGESYMATATFRIPFGLVGTYNVLVYTDNGAEFFIPGAKFNVTEENENNNHKTKPIRIEIPVLPDLQVASVIAPEETFTGGQMPLNWRVENKGTGNTPPDQMTWEDRIYLSKDNKFDATDRLIGSRNREGGLTKDGGYDVAGFNVSIPGDIAGAWYVFVFADGGNGVYEFDKENNNTNHDQRRPVNIKATPPDLITEWVTVPIEGTAARQITVKWKVTNQNPFPTKFDWVDTIYLSPDDTPDPKTDKAVGSLPHTGVLEPGKSYEVSTNVALTACISGRYFLYAYADSGNVEFEYSASFDAEANNASKLQAVQILALPPDLQITNLSNDATGNAGQPFNLSYTVTNKGIGATVETGWEDYVYLSPTPTFDEKTALLAGNLPRIGDVLSQNSYIRSTSVPVPTRAQGDYYVFIKTDAGNRVEECAGETNNIALSPNKISIKNNLPDFTVTNIQLQPGASLLSGNMVTVNWTVSNAGTTNALNQSWSDAVYFSTNDKLDNATLLATVSKTGPLNIGASYTNQAKVTLPVLVAPGTYYLIVQTDSGNFVFEGQREDNNTNFIAVPITIPPTDLAVTSVDAPGQGFSGQFVNVKWTVMNNGTQAPYVSSWTDYVYLSADQIFDPATDLSIGHLPHNGALAAGASYNANLDVRIPPGITGPFYVFVQTDRNRQVADNNLANNIAYDATPMVSQFAPPADLIVNTINVPPIGAPGEKATIQWSVKNQGINPAVGQWTDAVYLSKDTTWDSNDAVIGRVDHIGDLAVNATYNGTLEAALPAVLPGEYYVIVRTDVRNFVRENDETNNAGASSAKVKLDVPELTLGVAQSATLSFGQERYYKVNAPANETLRFTLDGNRDNKPQQPANELYARFGLLPSRSAYDFLFHRPYEPNQEIIVPDTQAGTYYSLARNAYLPANAQTDTYSIKAEVLPFGLRTVSPAITGNDRYTTITIEGAKFDSKAKVRLIAPNGVVLTPVIASIKTDKIKAIFDFKTASLGMYKAEVENPNGQKSVLENAVKVQVGSGAYVSVNVKAPSAIRPGRNGRFLITLTNSGTNDALQSFLFLQIPKGAKIRLEERLKIAYTAVNPPPLGIASWDEVSNDLEIDEMVLFPIKVPVIEAGKSVIFSVDVTPPEDIFELTVRAILTPSVLTLERLGQLPVANNRQKFVIASSNANEECPTREDCSKAIQDALIDLTKDLIKELIKDFFLDDLSNCTKELFSTIGDQLFVPVKDYLDGGISVREMIADLMPTRKAILECGYLLLGFTPAKLAIKIFKMKELLKKILTGVKIGERINTALKAYEACLQAQNGSAASGGSCGPNGGPGGGGSGGGSGSAPTPRAIDPNDKIGPKGFGLQGFITAYQNQSYQVNFENIVTATASAQRVRITDKLDPNLDWRTFRLKEIGFGKYRIPIPDNRAFYQGRLQLGEDLGNLVADISAGLDIATGQVTWTLTALDPKTGEQPNGADQGLLPPNDSTGRGQGSVTYTVQPKADVKTGTVIANSATIIFDTEEPITTNTVTNTIDADVPTSAVNALPATAATRTFPVSWSSSDPANGSGLQSFDVWYAEGDGAYQPLLSGTTDTSTTFTGQAGKSYRFYSIARDNAGNVEAAPSAPDAVTTIGQVNNPAPTLASLSPNALLVGANAFTLTVTGTNFVPESQVLWNGAARTTSYGSPTEVTATISATDVASASTATVTVTNPTPGGGTSAALPFAIQALGYEADVAPRPLGNGNGLVTIVDWVQMGRFAAGLDTPAVGSEFQRADCAPRPTLGDGRLTVSDWVQAGRYAAGLDSVFVLGGFTAPVSPPPAQFGEATASVLRIGNARFARGQVISLPIELDAQGTESGVAFSLNYDPKLMSFLDATLGTGASGGALQVNASQAGRVGLALVLPAGQQIAAGTKVLLTLRFLPGNGDKEDVANVTFGDQLIPREITDVRAFALPQVSYTTPR